MHMPQDFSPLQHVWSWSMTGRRVLWWNGLPHISHASLSSLNPGYGLCRLTRGGLGVWLRFNGVTMAQSLQELGPHIGHATPHLGDGG